MDQWLEIDNQFKTKTVKDQVEALLKLSMHKMDLIDEKMLEYWTSASNQIRVFICDLVKQNDMDCSKFKVLLETNDPIAKSLTFYLLGYKQTSDPAVHYQVMQTLSQDLDPLELKFCLYCAKRLMIYPSFAEPFLYKCYDLYQLYLDKGHLNLCSQLLEILKETNDYRLTLFAYQVCQQLRQLNASVDDIAVELAFKNHIYLEQEQEHLQQSLQSQDIGLLYHKLSQLLKLDVLDNRWAVKLQQLLQMEDELIQTRAVQAILKLQSLDSIDASIITRIDGFINLYPHYCLPWIVLGSRITQQETLLIVWTQSLMKNIDRAPKPVLKALWYLSRNKKVMERLILFLEDSPHMDLGAALGLEQNIDLVSLVPSSKWIPDHLIVQATTLHLQLHLSHPSNLSLNFFDSLQDPMHRYQLGVRLGSYGYQDHALKLFTSLLQRMEDCESRLWIETLTLVCAARSNATLIGLMNCKSLLRAYSNTKYPCKFQLDYVTKWIDMVVLQKSQAQREWIAKQYEQLCLQWLDMQYAYLDIDFHSQQHLLALAILCLKSRAQMDRTPLQGKLLQLQHMLMMGEMKTRELQRLQTDADFYKSIEMLPPYFFHPEPLKVRVTLQPSIDKPVFRKELTSLTLSVEYMNVRKIPSKLQVRIKGKDLDLRQTSHGKTVTVNLGHPKSNYLDVSLYGLLDQPWTLYRKRLTLLN
ncbi:hypothetical protein EDD86DRAFT_215265 [Gorgonomyces haynaldii]|nr:hypothetical protein EDD86DRAFT_215265 [Gorgonomyces haynaldii]